MTTHIHYHAHCSDGFAAAFIAWRHFRALPAPKLQFRAMAYGDPLPSAIMAGDEVYVLDFSYPRPVLEALSNLASKIVVLDHHKTAKAALEGLPYCTFAADKCGAVLTWEHFHSGVPVPLWLQHIQHRDLGAAFSEDPAVRDALPDHAAIHAGLWRATERSFDSWDNLLSLQESIGDDKFSLLNATGVPVLRSDERMMEELMQSMHWMTVQGFRVPSINTPVLQSELGNKLALAFPHAPFAVLYSQQASKRWRYSLRSSKDGADVSVIALQFPGGGGHARAAGFTIDELLA